MSNTNYKISFQERVALAMIQLIQTIARYLRTGEKSSPMAEEKHKNKTEETKRLISFANILRLTR